MVVLTTILLRNVTRTIPTIHYRAKAESTNIFTSFLPDDLQSHHLLFHAHRGFWRDANHTLQILWRGLLTAFTLTPLREQPSIGHQLLALSTRWSKCTIIDSPSDYKPRVKIAKTKKERCTLGTGYLKLNRIAYLVYNRIISTHPDSRMLQSRMHFYPST